jgi:hypothetical protein
MMQRLLKIFKFKSGPCEGGTLVPKRFMKRDAFKLFRFLKTSGILPLARTTFHGKYSHVADIVQLCQGFMEVIIEGIKDIPTPRTAKSGQKGYFHVSIP